MSRRSPSRSRWSSGEAPIVIGSRLLNRQDAEYETRRGTFTESVGVANPERDPRRHRTFNHRVLQPRIHTADDRQMVLGYQCTNSKMSIASAARHQIESAATFDVDIEVSPDEATAVVAASLAEGQSLKVTKFVSYHTSRYAPHQQSEIVDDAFELATRCTRSLDRVEHDGYEALVSAQEAWLDQFWASSEVEVRHRRSDDAGAEPPLAEVAEQQALHWNLFQLAQASAQVGEQGIAAKGVTGGGYEGHYFWDTEMYVAPFLSYTRPEAARQLLRFRWRMLPIARSRAFALNQIGALYPWRTINGEEASAYYAAGTAQYHINAAIAFALKRYVDASGDIAFLATDGAEILVETARLWNDLGFYSTRRDNNGGTDGPLFHIHGVTGPDEYTAVVNDNLYTNVMARFNLRYAARVLELLEESAPDAHAALARRVDLGDNEAPAWVRSAESMYLPYDEELGIHPQDADFLDLQPWDFEQHAAGQVPAAAALPPAGHLSPPGAQAGRRRAGDVVAQRPVLTGGAQAQLRLLRPDHHRRLVAVGMRGGCGRRPDRLWRCRRDYFREALFVDLADLHGNTRDGVHVASCGGVWGTIAFGFAGMYETGTAMSFDPKLPDRYEWMAFRVLHHGSRMRIELDGDGCTVTVVEGDPVPIHTTAGWTGLTPEPAGREAVTGMLEEAPPAHESDGDVVDRVVLIEAGQSIRIAAARTQSSAGELVDAYAADG